MSPFEPIGDEARWRTIYGLLKPLKPGDRISYATIAKSLDLDPLKDRHVVQMSTRRAAKEFLVKDSHALDVERNRGYVVVPAEQHLDIARRHQRKAGRSLARGHQQVEYVDLNALDLTTQKAFHVVASAFAQQRAVVERLNVKQRQLEQALDAMAPKVERSAEEIDELKARLERLEQNT